MTFATQEPPSLSLDALREAYQTVINASASIWYGTSDTMERGKVLASLESDPPFVIIHPDDASLLPDGARHLREYRPTKADLAQQAQKWLDERINQPIEYRGYDLDWWKELK